MFACIPLFLTTWLPFTPTASVEIGSALDFSRLGARSAPAGKYGHLKAVGDHFEFEGRKGVEQRFYGANLCFSACFPKTDEDVRTLVRRLASVGYNSVRIHHHDGGLTWGADDGTQLNPDLLDKLERLVFILKKAGFYLSTDLFVSRKVPWKTLGIDREGTVPQDEFKDLVRTNSFAQANLKRFVRSWLGHVNPYTGLSLAEDPVLAWISLVNENGVKGPEMLEIECAFAEDMRRFLREELKCRALISDLNGGNAGLGALYPRSHVCDYVDEHFYYAHPRFSGSGWTMPSRYETANPARHWAVGAFGAGARRLIDRPFTASEYHFCPPFALRGASGLLVGAQGALQAWNGIWRFAWGQCDWKSVSPSCREIGYFDICQDPVTLVSERLAVALFLRGDLKPLRRTAVVVVRSSELKGLDGQAETHRWQRAMWSAKVGVALDNPPKRAIVLGGREVFAASAETVLSKVGAPDGQLHIDGERGVFAIDTSRSKAMLAERGAVCLDGFSVSIRETPATFFAVSLDGKPLDASDRILVAHLTDVRNTDDRIPEEGVLEAFGKLPLQMRSGTAEISLARRSPGSTVYVLGTNGSRKSKKTATYADGRLVFVSDISANGKEPEYLYEIVSQTKGTPQ